MICSVLRKKWVIQILKGSCLGIFLLISTLFLLLEDEPIALLSPPSTPIFEDRYGKFLAEGLPQQNRFGFWDLQKQPNPKILKAIIRIEDHRFYQHQGIDYRSFLRAVWKTLFSSRREGASTLAMQVARMQTPGKRTILKKIQEMITAKKLIKKFGHQKILHHYLKIVPQGNRIHGIVYASYRYFEKPVKDLSWAEASLLASLPKSPTSMNLFKKKGFKQAKKRARIILQKLYQQKEFTKADLQLFREELLEMKVSKKRKRPTNSIHAILQIVKKYNSKKQNFQKPIRTSLDLSIQKRVTKVTRRTMSYLRKA
ncbi:MAG: penicillin-binding protein 1C, partial [bacterium]